MRQDDSNDDRYNGYSDIMNMVNIIEAIIIVMKSTKEKLH